MKYVTEIQTKLAVSHLISGLKYNTNIWKGDKFFEKFINIKTIWMIETEMRIQNNHMLTSPKQVRLKNTVKN